MGELVCDEDLLALRLQDGTTAGGHLISGTGTVTSVATGSGLTGGPITTTGTISLSTPVTEAHGGTNQTTYTDGQLLIGNSSGNGLSKATITAGSGISITNGHGSITVAATGGGAGGGFALDAVTTGTSHTVTLASPQTITYWTSATAGAKGTTLPGAAAGNSGYLWILKTTLGNGDTHTVTPAAGTIDGQSSYSFPDNKDAIPMISDGSSNWMIV